MQHLKKYIERINNWRDLTHKTHIDVDALTDATAQMIFESLDNDLSPENLHCDGEISLAEAQEKSVTLHGAGNDLLNMGFRPDCKYSEFA